MASTDTTFSPLTGSCVCKTVTYALTAPPLITQCCHCSHCQRESGSAFKINTVIESWNVQITSATGPQAAYITKPGKSQKIMMAICPNCYTALYARYDVTCSILCVLAGALDEESKKVLLPEVHIFTSTKVQWLDLKSEEARGIKIFEGYYDNKEVWSEESQKRMARLQEYDEKHKEIDAGQQTSTA